MPEEFFILFVLSIIAGSGIIFTWMIIAYLKSRHADRSHQSELTTSELRRMIGEAVRDATSPLEHRIEQLEEDRDAALRPQLPAKEHPARQLGT